MRRRCVNPSPWTKDAAALQFKEWEGYRAEEKKLKQEERKRKRGGSKAQHKQDTPPPPKETKEIFPKGRNLRPHHRVAPEEQAIEGKASHCKAWRGSKS